MDLIVSLTAVEGQKDAVFSWDDWYISPNAHGLETLRSL